MNTMPAANPSSYVDSYNPPVMATAAATNLSASAPMPAPVSASPSPSANPVSQALEDQNVFFLLGVSDLADAEKELFLDELQQVIWEDFLEQDVDLLITEEEMVDLKKIMANGKTGVEQQEEIITFLEKLVPDLEEIMLEKALELKGDMVKERIRQLREEMVGKTDQLESIARAEELIADDQWREAAEVLNSLAT